LKEYTLDCGEMMPYLLLYNFGKNQHSGNQRSA